MKKFIICIIVIALIFIMKIINYDGILVNETNLTFINSIIKPSLYNDEKEVSLSKIPIINYKIKDSILYIENSGDFYFPLGGIITNKNNSSLKIETIDSIYELEGINSYYNLYQYYDTYYPLGSGNNIIIKGDKIELILRYYEESSQIL